MCLVGASAVPAGAHDHIEIAPFVLHVGERRQRGSYVHSGWTSPSGRKYCVSFQGDGVYSFPGPLTVPPGQPTARIRLWKRQRPDRFTVWTYRGVDPSDVSAAPGAARERAPVRLRRYRSPGGDLRGWEAIFRPILVGDLYIEAFGQWRDRDGCGGDQSAMYTFHLRGGL